jgi:hypothetical protein
MPKKVVDFFNKQVKEAYERLTPDDEDCKAHAMSPDLAELNHF